MTASVSPQNLQSLARASRTAAVITGLGAVAVIVAMLYSATALTSTRKQLAAAEKRLQEIEREQTRVQEHLEKSRCALANSRSAIEAFHQRSYDLATSLYNDALICDPENAYLLNLAAYSHFKNGDVSGAIRLQRRSIEVDPQYGWGYFDLARFYCARDGARTAEAQAAIGRAIALDDRMPALMSGDGEFRRLCRLS